MICKGSPDRLLACQAPKKMEPQEGVQLFFNADSVQVVMAVGGAELILTASGTAALRVDGAVVVETAAPVLAREWVTIAVSFDGSTATILTAPHIATGSGSQLLQVASADVAELALGDGGSVTLAASGSIGEHYNGKLAGPAVRQN